MKPDVRLHQVHFWRRQVCQVKEGGLSVLFPKCLIALRLASVIPIILIVRALRPWVLVRFGQLKSPAFGEFAATTELYLCERDAGSQPNRSIDIFHLGYRISNQQLKKMWARTLHIFSLGRPLYDANSLLPGGKPHKIPVPTEVDIHGLLPRSRVHLFFTAEEERLGQAGLRDLGLPEGAPFVCIYARDTGYKGRDTGHKWSLLLNQDERLHGHRNSSIHNLVPAAEELARRGYFAIRMGAVVNEDMQATNPMIIDYASKARSDFMDIYLSAKCRFFLGSTGGPLSVPRIFRRPVVCVNLVPLNTGHLLAFSPAFVFIPKKLWLRDEGRFLTFREGLQPWPDWLSGSESYEHMGVEVIDNTPEELLAVAVEMDERLEGTWQTTEEDEELQQRFWSLLEMRDPIEEFRPRMGAEFLRQNRGLLD